MTKDNKKISGNEILKLASDRVEEALLERVEELLMETVKEIKRRDHWIARRTDQSKRFVEIQKDLVRAYDNGLADSVTLSDIRSRIDKIKVEKTSD